MKTDGRLGGHFVTGHVDGTGKILKIKKSGNSEIWQFSIPENLSKYIAEKGSAAIDGISLTIAKLVENKVGVSIIPHTWKNTNLNSRNIGAKVNIETDVIAKYIEKLLTNKKQNDAEPLSQKWFEEMGY